MDSNALASTEQRVLKGLIKVREERIEQREKELQLVIKSLEDELQGTKDGYQQQLQQTEEAHQQRIQELERQLQESQDEVQQTKLARDQYQQSNLSLLQQLQQMEQARQDIERQLQQCQETVHTQGQQLEYLCSQQDQHHWVVSKEEVTMTQEVLGGGAYGEVKVAVFRGLRVAAKSLHGMIISDYNQDVFYREMDIASKVRHPNLVQFIGATTVGTPILFLQRS